MENRKNRGHVSNINYCVEVDITRPKMNKGKKSIINTKRVPKKVEWITNGQ